MMCVGTTATVVFTVAKNSKAVDHAGAFNFSLLLFYPNEGGNMALFLSYWGFGLYCILLSKSLSNMINPSIG